MASLPLRSQNINVVEFSPELASHFGRLNRAWIEKDYAIEPPEEAMLARPISVIERGGAIIFAKRGDDVVGTAGLEAWEGGDFEIIKMAVEPERWGEGIGQLLMERLLRMAQERKARWVRIETAASLVPANGLYRKNGFVAAREQKSLHGYSRADMFYERRV
jgi:ribosomal protein S18 acetylase RimI-like enzyme